jgi:hypothetical protein
MPQPRRGRSTVGGSDEELSRKRSSSAEAKVRKPLLRSRNFLFPAIEITVLAVRIVRSGTDTRSPSDYLGVVAGPMTSGKRLHERPCTRVTPANPTV